VKICATTIGASPHGWFVEQQEAWLAHQGAADREHLLLATRQWARHLTVALLQPWKDFEHSIEIGLINLLESKRTHLEVFSDRHSGKHVPTLGHMTNAQPNELVSRNAINPLAEKVNAAG
jgi:hypothetical protein